MNWKRYITILILCAAVAGIQILVTSVHKEFYLIQLTMSAYYSLVVLGLCMLMGYAGQISLGQAGFFALGGYVSAILTTQNLMPYSGSTIVKLLAKTGILIAGKNLYGSDMLYFSPWISAVIAIAVTLLVAFAIGTPVLKLKGHYLAMATLGFGLIINKIALATKLFGQADGISEIPPLKIFSRLEISGNSALRVQNYYIAWFFVLVGIIILQNLINSRIGRAWRSLHGGEEAAGSIGVNTSRYKIIAFVVSAAFAAAGGILLTHYNGGIGPSESSITKSVRYLVIVAVGGMDNLWGALIMAIVLNFLSLRGYFGSYDDFVFGAILVIIMLFAPDGILRAFKRNRE